MRKTVKQEGDEDKSGGGGAGELSDLCRIACEGPRSGPLNMELRGAAMGAHTVRASGSGGGGQGLCLLCLTSHKCTGWRTGNQAAKGGEVGGAEVAILNSLLASDPPPPNPTFFSSNPATF